MNDEIIERVRKLLALSESPNEHEAAQAVALAHKLMEKHAISEAMLDTETPPDVTEQELMEPKSRLDLWRHHLATSLGHYHRCETYWSLRKRGSFKTFAIQIVGAKSDIDAVRYLFDYCVRQVNRLAEQHAGKGRVWVDNYRVGVVQGIDMQMARMHEEARRESVREHGASAEKALVRLDSQLALVEKHMERYSKVMQSQRTQRKTDDDARAEGQLDGLNVELGSGKGLAAGSKQIEGRRR